MNLDSDYWNQRYLAGATGWDIGSASPAIMRFLGAHVPKHARILIPGAGNAHEAIAAFRNGFANITVLDWALEARDRFLHQFPEFPESQFLCMDFFVHDGTYDLVLEQTFFCALDPHLRGKYAKHMASLLKQGGVLAGLWFDTYFESGPPFGGTRMEYEALFSPDFEIRRAEICTYSIPAREGRELWMELVKK